MKLLVLTCAVAALLLCPGQVHSDELQEHTTESPLADTALLADSVKPDALATGSAEKAEEEKTPKASTDRPAQTIADFIIHPLIALRPRVSETQQSKQAAINTTTSSPWQLFPFNAGQALGSSVSSLAGWLGSRIQLPGLTETPVRESSTTTTTTAKPDVIVRIQQRLPTKKPAIAITDHNNRPYKQRRGPNRFNTLYMSDLYDTDEYADDGEFYGNHKRHQYDHEAFSDEYDEGDIGEDDEDDAGKATEADDEQPVRQQNTYRRRNPRPMNYNKNRNTSNKINRLTYKQQQAANSAEDEQYDDYDDEEVFLYKRKPNDRRSQNEPTAIQRGQHDLLSQIKHFRGAQVPVELSNSMRKSQPPKNNKRHQQTTLIINRNGQAIYVAQELLQGDNGPKKGISNASKKRLKSQYPQPPLTVPYKRKGEPTQYLTIPWSQLGISPPNQIMALADGVQSQPLILNIPQSVIDNMQSLGPNRRKAVITADAVPLLAEASIMDIFQPMHAQPIKKAMSAIVPLAVDTRAKPRPTTARPGTVEKRPSAGNKLEDANNSADSLAADPDTKYIVIGDDFEDRKLSRSSYRQILNYFNESRVGRQVKGEPPAPVQVAPASEEAVHNDELQMTLDRKDGGVEEVKAPNSSP